MVVQRTSSSAREGWNRLIGLAPWRLAVLVFAIAFAVRVTGVIGSHQYHNLERYELERTAISLAQTGVYGNPYALPTGPSAHVSPGYVLILAAVFKIFGTSTTGELAKQILASAVTALQAALIPLVARPLRLDIRAGLLAATFCAVFPLKFGTETMGDWETPYTAIALMMVSVLMARIYRSSRFSTRDAVLAGFVWGISVLFAGLLLALFGAFLLVNLVAASRKDRPGYLRFCLIQCLIVAVCLAPWAIRNDRALGTPILTRTNLGIELQVSNNDIANADEHLNLVRGVYRTYHPFQSPDEALKLAKIGEVTYNRQAEKKALIWIREHRKRFFYLTMQRAGLFWFYMNPSMPLPQRMKFGSLALIHLIGLLGLVRLFRRNPRTAYVFAVILAVYPILNYFVHVGPRQSYPVDWILDLLMCTALVRFSTAIFRQERFGLSDRMLALPEDHRLADPVLPRQIC